MGLAFGREDVRLLGLAGVALLHVHVGRGVFAGVEGRGLPQARVLRRLGGGSCVKV